MLRKGPCMSMNDSTFLRTCCAVALLVCWALFLRPSPAMAGRNVISLDGQWEVAEGKHGRGAGGVRPTGAGAWAGG